MGFYLLGVVVNFHAMKSSKLLISTQQPSIKGAGHVITKYIYSFWMQRFNVRAACVLTSSLFLSHSYFIVSVAHVLFSIQDTLFFI